MQKEKLEQLKIIFTKGIEEIYEDEHLTQQDEMIEKTVNKFIYEVKIRIGNKQGVILYPKIRSGSVIVNYGKVRTAVIYQPLTGPDPTRRGVKKKDEKHQQINLFGLIYYVNFDFIRYLYLASTGKGT